MPTLARLGGRFTLPGLTPLVRSMAAMVQCVRGGVTATACEVQARGCRSRSREGVG
jgi:hypothetical protein